MSGAPTRIAQYRIEELLGAGGMGEVYAAFDEKLERRVALKLLPAARAGDAAARTRMLREARAASTLDHPGIVTVYEIGEADGVSYIAMELVQGETFAAMLERRVRLPPAEAVALVAEAAEALTAAHEIGVLHRDIKSANLMLDRRGRVRVLDFGLSKRIGGPASVPPAPAGSSRDKVPDDRIDADAPTAAASLTPVVDVDSRDPVTAYGARMGTPGYAAPELIGGEGADERSDVFSLTVVLYELIAGHRPFGAPSWHELTAQILNGTIAPLPAGAELDAVVARGLAAERDARFATPAALIAAARAALAPAAPPPAPPPVETPRRRPPIVPIAAVVIVAGGLATAFALTRSGAETTPPRADAGVPSTPPPAAATQLADVGAERALTALAACAYAPAFVDRDTVAFDLTRGDADELYRIALDGSAPVPLTHAAPKTSWRAAPGRRAGEVLYLETDKRDQAADAMVFLDVRTGAETGRVRVYTGGATWSDGALYYTVQGSSQIRRRIDDRDDVLATLPADRGANDLVADGHGNLAWVSGRVGMPRLCMLRAPATAPTCLDVTPAGGRPAFAADGSALYYDAASGIRRVEIDGTGDRLAVPGASAAGGVAVSPDGGALAWSDCRPRIQLLDLGGPAPSVVRDAPDLRTPAVGPAGVTAWVEGRADASSLMLREADGTVEQLVDGSLGGLSSPAFSASGDQIAMVVTGAHPGIYVVGTRPGARPNQITEDPHDSGPVWTVDDSIAFTRSDDRGEPHVYLVDTIGGGAPRLAIHGARQVLELDRASGELVVETSTSLAWWNPRTGKEHGMQSPPSSDPTTKVRFFHLAISPDSHWLLFQMGGGGLEFWRSPLGPHLRFERVAELTPEYTVGPGAIRDDGHVVAAGGVWSGELHVVPARAGAHF